MQPLPPLWPNAGQPPAPPPYPPHGQLGHGPGAAPQDPPAQPPAPVPTPPPALPPGTLLHDRYLIQGYIGGGGFGHIYKALDSALGYRRAIKEAFYQDAMTRHQFHLEAEFLLNTRHPNLVCGYAVFEQSGRLYLVMDYVDGNTLEEIAIEHIRRTGRPLPEYYVLDCVMPICGALQALHAAPVPVIHRDVKPANIKITRLGMPILIDLGLAKLYANGTQTIAPALAFTPGYAPPEQYRASGATDARTDVYGLGASLFYLLTGYQPTEAPARLGAIEAPPLRQLRPDLSAATEVAVLRAMELDPSRRQQSAFEFGAELTAARAAIESSGFLWNGAPRENGAVATACPRCGIANPPVARYCMRCGAAVAPLAPLTSDLPGAPDPSAVVATIQSAAESEGDRESVVDVPTVQSPAPAMLEGTDSVPATSTAESSVAVAHDMATQDRTLDAPDAPGEAAGLPTADSDTRSVARTPTPDAPATPVPSLGRWDQMSPWPQEREPDQPAMIIPVLHRGPAPAATPLANAAPRARRSASSNSPPRPIERPDFAAPAPEPRRADPGLVVPAAGERASRRSAANAAWHRAEAVVAPLRRVAARAQAGTVNLALPSIARWHAETVTAAAPLDEREARAGIAAVMAVVLTVISLLAVRYWWALALVLPGLILAHWCVRAKTAMPTPEARWLAMVAMVVGYCWLALFAGVFVLLVVWGR